MFKSRCCVTLAVIYCLAGALTPTALGADRKDVIREARRSYYDLKSKGLAGFECQVSMDWDSMFKTLKPDATGRDQVIPILKKTQFQVLVGPEGASTVSHHSDVAPPNEEVAGRVRQSTGGVEQVLTGFFQTWSGFMMGAPFPEADGDYLLENLGENYRLTYKETSVDVVISMAHDFTIDEMRVTTPDFEARVHPEFARNQGEFVLLGYEATYKAASGAPQQLSMKIENRDVQGFSLPATVTATVDLPAGKLEMPLIFSDCKVTKR